MASCLGPTKPPPFLPPDEVAGHGLVRLTPRRLNGQSSARKVLRMSYEYVVFKFAGLSTQSISPARVAPRNACASAHQVQWPYACTSERPGTLVSKGIKERLEGAQSFPITSLPSPLEASWCGSDMQRIMSDRRAASAALLVVAICILSPASAQDGAALCANGGKCLDGIASACSCAGSDAEVR